MEFQIDQKNCYQIIVLSLFIVVQKN